MGRYLKNRELESASYSIRMPVTCSTSVGPNCPVDGLIRFNDEKKRPEIYMKGRWRPFAITGEIPYPDKDIFYGDAKQTVFGPMKYSYPTGNEILILVFIHNVYQVPGLAYIVDGYEINFTSPPPMYHPIVILYGIPFFDYAEPLAPFIFTPPALTPPAASTTHWTISNFSPYPAREGKYIGVELGLTTAGLSAGLSFPQNVYLKITPNRGNIESADFGNFKDMYGDTVNYTVSSNELTANLDFRGNTTVHSYLLDIADDASPEVSEDFRVAAFIDSAMTSQIGYYDIEVNDTSWMNAIWYEKGTTTTTTTLATTTTTTIPYNEMVSISPGTLTSTVGNEVFYTIAAGALPTTLLISGGAPNSNVTIIADADPVVEFQGLRTLNGGGAFISTPAALSVGGSYRFICVFDGTNNTRVISIDVTGLPITTTTTTLAPANYSVVANPYNTFTTAPFKVYNYIATVGQSVYLDLQDAPPGATWSVSGTAGANRLFVGSTSGTVASGGTASVGTIQYSAAGVYQVDYTFTGFSGTIMTYYGNTFPFVRLEITVT